MFKNKIFGKKKKKKEEKTDAMASLQKLNETLEMLEKKAQGHANKVEKAKELLNAEKKQAALQCLRQKTQIDKQIEKLKNMQLLIHNQRKINDLDKAIDEINEQTENMKQIQQALANPVGAAADIIEDKLEAELEELQASELELEIPMTSNTSVMHAAPVDNPACELPAKHEVRLSKADEDELASLQAKMK